MAGKAFTGAGTREDPWQLTTPGGNSAFEAFRDPSLDPPSLVVRSGRTELRYQLRAVDDLHAMLKAAGDWVPLGGADEQKPAAEGTVEAWARDQGIALKLDGRGGVWTTIDAVNIALGVRAANDDGGRHGPELLI